MGRVRQARWTVEIVPQPGAARAWLAPADGAGRRDRHFTMSTEIGERLVTASATLPSRKR
jgi:hypothetical protein